MRLDMDWERDWRVFVDCRTGRRKPDYHTRTPVPVLRLGKSNGQWPRCLSATRPCGSNNRCSGMKTRLRATDGSFRKWNNLPAHDDGGALGLDTRMARWLHLLRP